MLEFIDDDLKLLVQHIVQDIEATTEKMCVYMNGACRMSEREIKTDRSKIERETKKCMYR